MSRSDPIPDLKRQVGATLATLLAGWNADDVAALIGTDRPRISELRRGKLDRFSLETLIRYVTRLRHRVEIVITRERIPRRPGGPTLLETARELAAFAELNLEDSEWMDEE